jgi:hypothetical protein
VRREDEPRQPLGAARERALDGLRDPRLPVAHPREDGQPELALERRARLIRDRVQRRGLVDPEPPVALDEVLEQLRADRPPAADVGVVGGDVGEPLGAPVGHQDRHRAHRGRR